MLLDFVSAVLGTLCGFFQTTNLCGILTVRGNRNAKIKINKAQLLPTSSHNIIVGPVYMKRVAINWAKCLNRSMQKSVQW